MILKFFFFPKLLFIIVVHIKDLFFIIQIHYITKNKNIFIYSCLGFREAKLHPVVEHLWKPNNVYIEIRADIVTFQEKSEEKAFR